MLLPKGASIMTVTSFVWLLNVIVFIVCENGRYVPIVNVRTGFDVILRGDYHSQTNMTWRQYMCNDTVTCTHRNVVSNVTASAPVDCGASTGTAAKAHCEYDG